MSKRFKKLPEKTSELPSEGIEKLIPIIKKNCTTKFDESVDLSFQIYNKQKKNEINIRTVVNLPGGTGKKVKVAVVCEDAKISEAKDAGADIVGSDELVEKVENGFVDFDRCISTPDMMSKVGKLGKVLGPRNLMPNPKLGSVTNDLKQAVENAKAGELEYKNNDTLVQAGIAKSDFEKNDVINNIKYFFDTISKERPSGIKGDFIKKVSISPTMGPGINVNLDSFGA